jgi:hypothetical protein
MKRILIIAASLTVGLSAWGQVAQTFCSNIAGNIACTTYDDSSSSQSYCTSIAGNLSCTTYGHTDQYDRVQVQQNYAAGYVIGTTLGNLVVAAIEDYKNHRRDKQEAKDLWSQYVQGVLTKVELQCETDPSTSGDPAGCREDILAFNQFFHRHATDFVPDHRNMGLLTNELARQASAGTVNDSMSEEQMLEKVYQDLDKKQLDKKPYIETANSRYAWTVPTR